MLRTLLALLVLCVATLAPALADDEGSEHTAVLAGDSADTIGVTTAFDAKTGWSMTVREKPGATARTYSVGVPPGHSHFVVYVSPARTAITWMESSPGYDGKPLQIDGKRTLAWVYSPQGKLVRTFTYGSVFTSKQIAAFPRSTSHIRWHEGFKATAKGLEVTVAGGKRTIVLDTAATTLR